MQLSIFQAPKPIASEGSCGWLRLEWITDTMFIPRRAYDWRPSPGDVVQIWRDDRWFQMTVAENEKTPLTFCGW